MEKDWLYMGSNEEEQPKKEEKKKLEIEKLNDELKNIEIEINKIYDELNESKIFSLYNVSYLLKRIKVMQIRINEIIRSDYHRDVTEKYTKIRNKVFAILIIGLSLINLFPTISIFVCATMVGLDLKYIYNMKDIQKRLKMSSDEYILRLTSFKDTSLNCIDLIQDKLKIIDTKTKLSKSAQQEDKFVIANNIIVDLVNKRKSEYIDENLSQDICDIIRKILQDDLSTDENNLSILIDMAREKNNTENLLNEFGIKRKVLGKEL